jgi:ubiquinol-cytochrome c reductase cytochrome b subunit
MHSTGASLFFIVVYLHMFRALIYGSHQKPRELVWILGMLIFLTIAAFIMFFVPTFGGLFLEHDNFNVANPMVTPQHIKPVWYFTPYYAMLRAVPDKLFGVMTMGGAVMILFLLPWLDRSPVKSIRYRSTVSKVMITLFCLAFVALGYLGMQSGSTTQTLVARLLTAFYFGFFIAMPFWSRLGATKPVPDRVTMHD